MTTYLIKVILCSGVFFLTYKLLLEKERMHVFNRLYLLSSLLFSFIIPVITFSSSIRLLAISENEIINTKILQDNRITSILSPGQSTHYIFSILLTIYIIITTLLFIRFVSNLNKIISKSQTHPIIRYKSSKIILINEDLTPHSFLNYLFINKKEYKNGDIENEILIHENAHIQQKHSYDILFMEILQTVFWFNPILFLYKKAIQLNHEFLADEVVINSFPNVSRYQYLLISKTVKNKTSNLTSQFNHSITKKRLIMMTKTKSVRNSLFRKIAVILVVAISIFAFSIKSIAQDRDSTDLKDFKITIENTINGFKMQSIKGSAWIKTSFSIASGKSMAIDEYGMTKLDEVSSSKDSNLADYLFTITKSKKVIILKGIEGTAWKELRFTLKINEKQTIDQFGMIE